MRAENLAPIFPTMCLPYDVCISSSKSSRRVLWCTCSLEGYTIDTNDKHPASHRRNPFSSVYCVVIHPHSLVPRHLLKHSQRERNIQLRLWPSILLQDRRHSYSSLLSTGAPSRVLPRECFTAPTIQAIAAKTVCAFTRRRCSLRVNGLSFDGSMFLESIDQKTRIRYKQFPLSKRCSTHALS